MTSRGSRRLLLSGNELKERGRREAPLLFVVVSVSVRSKDKVSDKLRKGYSPAGQGCGS